MRRICLIGFIGAAFTAMSVVAAAGQGTGDRPVTVAFSNPSRPGLLKVNLLQGGITIKAYNGKDVIINSKPRDSSRSRRAPAPEAQGLHRIDAASNGLTVEEDNNVMTVGSNQWNQSLDLEIQVPTRTNLQVKTVNGGSVLIEGVDGDIEAGNDNGSVVLTDVSGSVVAHSLNGKVVATLKRATAEKPMSFTSMNGNVDVTLPPDIKANVKLRTDNGDVWTDFDVQVRPSPAPVVQDNRKGGGRYRLEVDKNILGSINGGGPDFEMRSMNGNVYIRKGK